MALLLAAGSIGQSSSSSSSSFTGWIVGVQAASWVRLTTTSSSPLASLLVQATLPSEAPVCVWDPSSPGYKVFQFTAAQAPLVSAVQPPAATAATSTSSASPSTLARPDAAALLLLPTTVEQFNCGACPVSADTLATCVKTATHMRADLAAAALDTAATTVVGRTALATVPVHAALLPPPSSARSQDAAAQLAAVGATDGASGIAAHSAAAAARVDTRGSSPPVAGVVSADAAAQPGHPPGDCTAVDIFSIVPAPDLSSPSFAQAQRIAALSQGQQVCRSTLPPQQVSLSYIYSRTDANCTSAPSWIRIRSLYPRCTRLNSTTWTVTRAGMSLTYLCSDALCQTCTTRSEPNTFASAPMCLPVSGTGMRQWIVDLAPSSVEPANTNRPNSGPNNGPATATSEGGNSDSNSSSSSSNRTSSRDQDMSVGVIVVIVMLVLILIGIATTVAYAIVRLRRRDQKQPVLLPSSAPHSSAAPASADPTTPRAVRAAYASPEHGYDPDAKTGPSQPSTKVSGWLQSLLGHGAPLSKMPHSSSQLAEHGVHLQGLQETAADAEQQHSVAPAAGIPLIFVVDTSLDADYNAHGTIDPDAPAAVDKTHQAQHNQQHQDKNAAPDSTASTLALAGEAETHPYSDIQIVGASNRDSRQWHASKSYAADPQSDELAFASGDLIIIDSPWTDGTAQAINVTAGKRGSMALSTMAALVESEQPET
ncbi:hypothetical protein BC831DRAFT_510828 [Entophlyctis helioformis]|nr:hypothetical protein BC831DRAFT_510828 [Entophlyctis helioformis]